MNDKCILVKSVTYAQKAKKLLTEKGIRVRISKQNYGPEYSCAWCVKVPAGSVREAILLMDENGVKRKGENVFDDLPG